MSEDQKTALQVERETMDAAAKAENDTRTGVGLRVVVGATRGKATQNIKYEAFDTDKPDTLPGSFEDFQSVTGVSDDALLVQFLIDGFNDYQYRQASDPIAEFINPLWPAEVKASFRISVRAYAKSVESTIEEAASMMVPLLNKKWVA